MGNGSRLKVSYKKKKTKSWRRIMDQDTHPVSDIARKVAFSDFFDYTI